MSVTSTRVSAKKVCSCKNTVPESDAISYRKEGKLHLGCIYDNLVDQTNENTQRVFFLKTDKQIKETRVIFSEISRYFKESLHQGRSNAEQKNRG